MYPLHTNVCFIIYIKVMGKTNYIEFLSIDHKLYYLIINYPLQLIVNSIRNYSNTCSA